MFLSHHQTQCHTAMKDTYFFSMFKPTQKLCLIESIYVLDTTNVDNLYRLLVFYKTMTIIPKKYVNNKRGISDQQR